MNYENIIGLLKELIITYGPKLLLAIVVLIVGGWVIKAITKATGKVMLKKEVDASLQPFLKGIVNMLLRVMLIISVLGMVGIEMTSFIAVLGAAGLAVGMALSGALQNFAGGVMILAFKPFKAGDMIEAVGYTGTVNSIQIFNTILKTPDNKTIIIPNGELYKTPMTNYSTEERRRVDWTFGIGYGDDTSKARLIIKQLSDEDKRIHKDPEVFIAVSALADSSVNFTVRAWVNASDYWGVFFDMNDKIYNAFSNQGINIPFPQMDVHVHNAGKN